MTPTTFLATALLVLSMAAHAAPVPTEPGRQVAFQLKPQDTVALVGGSNIERTRFNGHLQTYLIAAKPELKIKVRNFGWEGDTVFEQWRDAGTSYAKLEPKRRAAEKRISTQAESDSWRQQRDWRQQLREAGVTVVIAQFGQMESLNGAARLPQFVEAYEGLIADLADEGRRVVLVAPVAFEGKMQRHNPDLSAYSEAIGGLARKLGLVFVGGAPAAEWTENGYQLSEQGHRAFAAHVVKALGLEPTANEAVRREVLEFERLWFDYWRPMNWAFLTGDRTNVPYSKDWKDTTGDAGLPAAAETG
jgi:hypothetical protein